MRMQVQTAVAIRCELDGGRDAGAEARAIGGEGCGCEGEEAKYETLGANPVVL